MNNEEQERKVTLDHMVDEKFAEIFFIAKEEYDVQANSLEERRLYGLLDEFKFKLKKKCKDHFGLVGNESPTGCNYGIGG
tara:strand:- start:349 stop:588 length:240 start_codon:yes stop_codon:yes gene_type:complete